MAEALSHTLPMHPKEAAARCYGLHLSERYLSELRAGRSVRNAVMMVNAFMSMEVIQRSGTTDSLNYETEPGAPWHPSIIDEKSGLSRRAFVEFPLGITHSQVLGDMYGREAIMVALRFAVPSEAGTVGAQKLWTLPYVHFDNEGVPTGETTITVSHSQLLTLKALVGVTPLLMYS